MAWEYSRARPDSTDLLLCVPHTGSVRTDWPLSLKHLDMPPGVRFMTYFNQGQPIDLSRNIFVSVALQRDARYLFFLDSDVEMPNDGLVKLYNAHKPIIAGVHSGRMPPYGLSANVNRNALSHEMVKKYPEMIMDVQEIGMGCCLIDMRVIQRIARNLKMQWRCIKSHAKELQVPIRPDEISPDEIAFFSNEEAQSLRYKCGYCQSSLIADFFLYTMSSEILSRKYGLYSEDYFFCKLARDAGFPVSIHLGVFANHELLNMKITKDGLYNPVSSAGDI